MDRTWKIIKSRYKGGGGEHEADPVPFPVDEVRTRSTRLQSSPLAVPPPELSLVVPATQASFQDNPPDERDQAREEMQEEAGLAPGASRVLSGTKDGQGSAIYNRGVR